MFNQKNNQFVWGAPESWGTPIGEFKTGGKQCSSGLGIEMGGQARQSVANSWGKPNAWNEESAGNAKVGGGPGFMNNSWGSPSFQNWGGGGFVPVVNVNSTVGGSNAWGSPGMTSWTKKPEKDLFGE